MEKTWKKLESCKDHHHTSEMGTPTISSNWHTRRTNETMQLVLTIFVGIICGFFLGVSFPTLSFTKVNLSSIIFPRIILEDKFNNSKIWVPSNPRGAEGLPPGFIAAESDLYTRKLWGLPSEDLIVKPTYLITFTVGYVQKNNIDAAVKKLTGNFTILLFHYDGRTSEWDEFEWSKRVIHVSVHRQTKWWYAKRFLHPDIVAPYDYIFIWDEDLGVDNFDPEEYIKLVKKHGLHISQPGLSRNSSMTWEMTRRRNDTEVHNVLEDGPSWCSDPPKPPCAEFVEIMAPVFSRDAWRCVWYMIQNDLVHGWGLDFAFRKCVESAHERIGVVDSQWIVHQAIPSLGRQGKAEKGKVASERVQDRCKNEWMMFQDRVAVAEKSYFEAKTGSL